MKRGQFWRAMLYKPCIALRQGKSPYTRIVWFSYVIYPYGIDGVDTW